MQLLVTDFTGKSYDTIDLSDYIFGIEANHDAISRVVRWQLACARSGNHATKNRSQVNKTTKKAFRQKGTGNARRGSLSTNILRGGGVSHGPVVRSHAYTLPKKVRRLALRSALSLKAKSSKIMIWNSLDVGSYKTKEFANHIKELKIESALIIGNSIPDTLTRSSRNIPKIDYINVDGMNVRSLLSRDTIVIDKGAIESIEKRCI